MTETGAQRFEAAWREACANGENVADAIGRLLDEQGTRLARVAALADEWERPLYGLRQRANTNEDFRAVHDQEHIRASCAKSLRAALAPEAEGATS